MTADCRIIGNQKYMWDRKAYDTEPDALNAAAAYKNEKFDTQLISESGKYYVYTRRLIRGSAAV
jgi:hypothetical protein